MQLEARCPECDELHLTWLTGLTDTEQIACPCGTQLRVSLTTHVDIERTTR